jgi:tetratricopeptide (TPR) repeat protein
VRQAALAAAALLLLLAPACRRQQGGAGPEDPLASARALVADRRFDEAIAAVGDRVDAEALYLLGRAWAGKAQDAPVPTPSPGAGPSERTPLKAEEQQALGFFERATALRPDHAGAHLGVADLLAPHAVAEARRSGGAAPAERGVDRVLQAYGNAMQADPAGTESVEGMIRFASAVGRVAEADAAFEELVRRRREDAVVLVRYGDFLAGQGANPEGALARYAQALIWRPDDTETRLKMASIHLAAASALLGERQYAAAEARLRDARRFATDSASPEAARLRELEARLRDIRGR